ncbi:MAG TPA: HPr-rel-A system PqqD family peptide chaperone [Burkholderiaceae bacterium]|jgi:PqqD family protein of HPr-rel-A system
MKWRVISNEALHFRSWNDEFVVYNSLSGDTHLLGSATAQILLNLLTAPSDAATLAAALAPFFEVAPTADLPFQIDQLLSELNTLALVEPI